MNIKVENSIPNIKVTVNQNADGSCSVVLTEVVTKLLKDFAPGSTVKIGNREYIVLEHSKDTTAIITKEFAKKMAFGDSGDYTQSDVRKYCNGEFYDELAAAVGENNIITHTVKLMADDGTGKDVSCKDKVSILTADLYRRYREYLPAYGSWWWLATRVTATVKDWLRCVCCVRSGGTLGWDVCDFCHGVRPFCILNSSISVS